MQNRSTDVALCSRCLYVWSIPFVQHDSLIANADSTLTKLQLLLNLKQYFSLVKVSIDSCTLKTEDASERQLYGEGKNEELLLVLKFGSNVSSKLTTTTTNIILILNSADLLVHLWAFYNWEKTHAAVPQAIFFGISLCSGWLINSRSSEENRSYCVIENGALGSDFSKTAAAMAWICSKPPWKVRVLGKGLRKIRKIMFF